MRNIFLLLGGFLVVGLASGCANTEKKFSRGMNNTFEIVRGGEFRRSMEQTTLFEGTDAGMSSGFFHGLNRSLARTGLGIYEVVTAPFPPYDPIYKNHFAPGPVYPDNFEPGTPQDSLFATDTHIGFSGGDVAPFVPGSRFRVFDTK